MNFYVVLLRMLYLVTFACFFETRISSHMLQWRHIFSFLSLIATTKFAFWKIAVLKAFDKILEKDMSRTTFSQHLVNFELFF